MFDRVDRRAATVSVSINNSRVAEKLHDPRAALEWARTGWERASLVDDELKASAAFELARQLRRDEPREAIRMWRESARHSDACGSIENAAIAARNAAFAARRMNDLRTAIPLLESTAERYRTRRCQGSREFPRCDHGNSPPSGRPVSAGLRAAMASRWRRMR